MRKKEGAGIGIHLGKTVRTPLERLYSPLRRMMSGILSSHRVSEGELSVTFVGRDKIRALNREYLGSARVTDVIAFDLSSQGQPGASKRAGEYLFADIYICFPRALEQAADYGVSEDEELARLAAHGLLHLLGYDHKTSAEARRMNLLQEQAVKEGTGETGKRRKNNNFPIHRFSRISG